MNDSLYAQLIGLFGGLLLLTAVGIVWRRSISAEVRLLAVQGGALGGLVAVLGVREGSAELLGVAGIVLALKVAVLPGMLSRAVARHGAALREETPLINTTASLLALSLLTMLAFLVSRPLLVLGDDPAIAAVPIGVALVLYGFLVLATRRHAFSQLIGFLVLDNGIGTVAFLTAGGVPLVVGLGATRGRRRGGRIQEVL